MKLSFFSAPQTYYWKIIQLISAVVVLAIMVLSTTVYLYSHHVLLQREYESNRKVFDQVKINIDMMDTMSGNLCRSIFLNGDVSAVMYAQKEDIVDATTRTNRIISTTLSANPYVHSVTIYNQKLKQFYNLGESLFFDDLQLQSVARNAQVTPQLKAVSRTVDKLVNHIRVSEPVFTYFMYTLNQNSNELEGAMALNVRTDWFLKNIRQINMINKDQGEDVFVLDGTGGFIAVDTQVSGVQEWVRQEYQKHAGKNVSAQASDYFQSNYEGTEYVISYMFVPSMNISLIKVQKLSEVYRSINAFRTTLMIITVAFLLVAVLLTMGISRRIYRPVGNLVRQIGADPKQAVGSRGGVDEIKLLSDFYASTMEKLDRYKQDKHANQNLLKQYGLVHLLEESHGMRLDKMAAFLEESGIGLSVDRRFQVCLLKIDQYKAFTERFNTEERDVLRFAFLNIAAEVIGREFRNEGIDLKDEHMAVLVELSDGGTGEENTIPEMLREIQGYIQNYFECSVSASVSPVSEGINGISAAYAEARDQFNDRLKMGLGCLLTPRLTVAQNGEDIPKAGEEQLVAAIAAQDYSAVQIALDRIFQDIRTLEYDSILISLISTASAIRNATENLKQAESRHLRFDFGAVCRCIMESETLAEIRAEMEERLRVVLESTQEPKTQEKNCFIVEAVREYIQNHYRSSDLSMTSIAVVLNISARRLSKVFKDEMKMSIADYINDVRLDKAAELLTTTALNVNEVVAQLGIENETYFYGMFKKRFGLTPKEYAFRRIVKMTRE